LKHDGYAFFSQQRVGKTLPSLAVADARKPDILFIVCPKGAIKTWRKQLKEHLKIDWPCETYIIHYQALCRNAKDRKWYRYKFRHEWPDKTTLLIVDEAHRCKKLGSMQSRMVRSLADLSTWQLILSGTPTDKFEDYYAQFQIIQPGVLGHEYEDFRDEYLKMGGYKNKQVIGYKHVDQLRAIVQKYSHRTTLREAQIEAGRKPYLVKRTLIKVKLEPETREIYNELDEKLEAVVNKKKVKVPLVLTLSQKLQQIAGGFLIHKEQLYNDDGTPLLNTRGKPIYDEEILTVGREKLTKLSELLTMNSLFRQEKFVVCANYTHELDAIARRLRRLGWTYKRVDGNNPFDGIFDTDCVLLQVRSGEAIDLAEASTYIFYSWNWSYINYEQAMFRVLKFTSRIVKYFYLIAENTIDEDSYEAVMTKQKFSRLVIDNRRHKKAA